MLDKQMFLSFFVDLHVEIQQQQLYDNSFTFLKVYAYLVCSKAHACVYIGNAVLTHVISIMLLNALS